LLRNEIEITEGKERCANHPPATLFEQFLKEREHLKNVTPRTLVWYRTAFKNYQAALADAAPSLPTKATMQQFVVAMRDRGVRPVTCNTNIAAMNAFCLWLQQLYTAAFRRLLRDSGVTPVVLRAWSPNLNAFAERFVGSAKSECVDRMVLLGEGHLRAAVDEFVRHDHEERPHQGLGNEFIAPQATTIATTGPLKCRQRLGGLLKFYYREAASPRRSSCRILWHCDASSGGICRLS